MVNEGQLQIIDGLMALSFTRLIAHLVSNILNCSSGSVKLGLGGIACVKYSLSDRSY